MSAADERSTIVHDALERRLREAGESPRDAEQAATRLTLQQSKGHARTTDVTRAPDGSLQPSLSERNGASERTHPPTPPAVVDGDGVA